MTKQLWAAAELAILVQHQHSDAAAHAALRRAGYRRTMNAVSARINRIRSDKATATESVSKASEAGASSESPGHR